jgi:hypothetical protein
MNQAPDGAKENCAGWFSFVPAGAWMVLTTLTHGFTVGYYLRRLRRFHLPMLTCRAVALAKARAQIFFQPARRAEVKRRRSEAAFKDVVIPPNKIIFSLAA